MLDRFGDFVRALWWTSLIMAITMALHVIDPFNAFRNSGDASRDYVARVIAPWWGVPGSGWRLKADQEATSVVLFTQQQGETWPPTFEDQVKAIAEIASHCPEVIAVDIIFDIPREHRVSLIDALSDIYAADAPEVGCRPPTIIFADTQTKEPGKALIDDIYEFVGRPCGEAPSLLPFLKTSAPCKEGEVRSFATVAWDNVESDRTSSYFRLDNREYYRLTSRKPEWSAAAAEDGATGGGGRPSLALAAFMARCARDYEAGYPLCEGISYLDEAVARFGQGAGGIAASQPFSNEMAETFARPMALRWPRWPPYESRRFVSAPPGDGGGLFAPGACLPKGQIGAGTRLWESLTMIVYGTFAGNPDAVDNDERLCFPFMTFEVQKHLFMNCSDFESAMSAATDKQREITSNPISSAEEINAAQQEALTARQTYDLCTKQQSPTVGVPHHISGKTVFVGFYNNNGSDLVQSPVHGDLPGVFRHAVAFENLVRLGEDYPSTPKTNLVTIKGFPIGQALLFEMGLLALMTVIRLYLAFRKERDFPSRTETPQAMIVTLFWRLLNMFCYVALALAVTVLISVWMDWSVSNWIRVSALGAGTYAMGTYLLGLRFRSARQW